MTKRNFPFARRRGYTLIELLMVVAIVGILASIAFPRFGVVLQRAYQATARSNLGNIRSAIALYYTEQEGVYPMQDLPDGYPDTLTPPMSLSEVLCPRYIPIVPTPQLKDLLGNVNGVGVFYDETSKTYMEHSLPIKDVIIMANNRENTLGFFRPYAYDNKNGTIFINNDNWDVLGEQFYKW